MVQSSVNTKRNSKLILLESEDHTRVSVLVWLPRRRTSGSHRTYDTCVTGRGSSVPDGALGVHTGPSTTRVSPTVLTGVRRVITDVSHSRLVEGFQCSLPDSRHRDTDGSRRHNTKTPTITLPV